MISIVIPTSRSRSRIICSFACFHLLTIWVALSGQAKRFDLAQPITFEGTAETSKGTVVGMDPVKIPGTTCSAASKDIVEQEEVQVSGASPGLLQLSMLVMAFAISVAVLCFLEIRAFI